MKLNSPFIIGPRLCPSVQIGSGSDSLFLSLDESGFILDGSFGEHRIRDFRPGMGRHSVESLFESILSFMEAAAESFRYAERNGKDGMEGENSGLFPKEVTECLAKLSDELGMIRFEIADAIENEVELIEE